MSSRPSSHSATSPSRQDGGRTPLAGTTSSPGPTTHSPPRPSGWPGAVSRAVTSTAPWRPTTGCRRRRPRGWPRRSGRFVRSRHRPNRPRTSRGSPSAGAILDGLTLEAIRHHRLAVEVLTVGLHLTSSASAAARTGATVLGRPLTEAGMRVGPRDELSRARPTHDDAGGTHRARRSRQPGAAADVALTAG